MEQKPKPKPDDPAQYKRFLEAAEKAGADKTEKGADSAFRKISISKAAPNRKKDQGKT